MKRTRRTSKSDYDTRKSYIEIFYKKYREAWEGYHDSRIVFCNMYDQIMNALEEMKGIKSSMIWVGFDKEVKENEKIMKDIIKAHEPSAKESR